MIWYDVVGCVRVLVWQVEVCLFQGCVNEGAKGCAKEGIKLDIKLGIKLGVKEGTKKRVIEMTLNPPMRSSSLNRS